MSSPCFFGGEDRQLFGVYHEPEGGRDEAVLLCYPFGHEYLRAHKAFRRLAENLARSGYHVFRFDYFGTGDSAGDHFQAEIRDWRSDIALAARELADISGARRVSVIGLRLGALLAATAVSSGEISVNRLILWDPVISGPAYVRELAELDRRKLACPYYPRSQVPAGSRKELYGFEINDKLRSQMDDLDLLGLKLDAARVTVLARLDARDPAGTRESFERLASEVVEIPDEGGWLDVARSGQALLAARALREISRVMEARA